MKSWEQRTSFVLSVLRLDSIKNKIVGLAVVATLLPALSTAILSYAQNRRALTESLEGELRGVGSQTARELDLWVKERFYDVRVFVGSYEVSENLERISLGGPVSIEARARLTDYLTAVHGPFGDYTELLVFDDTGRPVASSVDSLRDATIPPEWLPRLRRGETVLGDPLPVGATVAATLAVPIGVQGGGPYLGSLTATLTFGAVRDLLEGYAPGETGRVDLVMRDGRVIASSEGVGTAVLQPLLPESTLSRLAAAPGDPIEYADSEGLPTVGTLTPVPSLEWAVVAQMPSAEAYAQVTQLRNSTFLLVSALLLGIGVTAYLLALIIVRPLARLTEGARAVAAGDLSVDLPVTGRGEVGYLTEVFNEMVGRLRRGREQLDEANAALRRHNKELEHISMTDGLTGLYNRRYLMDSFEKEIQRHERHDRNFCVLMMDVDRFKQYNDTYGHVAGDKVLAGMGGVIQDATRDPDIPARFGGEEFVVILPECDLRGAVDAAERIRARLGEEVFEGGAVTISVGAAEFPTHGDTASGLVAAADVAMYEAKRAGRDRVMAASDGVAPKGAAPKKDPVAKRRTDAEAKAAAKEKGSTPAKRKAPKKKAAAKKSAPKSKASASKDKKKS